MPILRFLRPGHPIYTTNQTITCTEQVRGGVIIVRI